MNCYDKNCKCWEEGNTCLKIRILERIEKKEKQTVALPIL